MLSILIKMLCWSWHGTLLNIIKPIAGRRGELQSQSAVYVQNLSRKWPVVYVCTDDSLARK